MKTKHLKILGALAISAVTAWGIYKVFTSSINPQEVLESIDDFSPVEIAGILALSTLLMIVRAYRFHLLLQDAGEDLSLWQTIKIFITGQVFSPLPGGEGSRPVLLKKEADIDLEQSVTPMIVLGITEMIAAVIITLAGSIFLDILRIAAAIALIGVAGLVWIAINHKIVRAIFNKLPDHPKVLETGKVIVGT